MAKFNVMTHKEKQLEIILQANPMNDDYHTGIRTIDDILTFEEALEQARHDSDWTEDGKFIGSLWNDVSPTDYEEALLDGEIRVYSSYPIENGTFVSPSYNQAYEYAGHREPYSKVVKLEDVAWINIEEGEYANVNSENDNISDDF